VQLSCKPASNDVNGKSAEKELAVLRLIHRHPDVSRVELVKLTGYSAGSITGIVQSLLTKHLVTELQGRPTSAGRKPLALNIRNDAAYVVGVDLGSFYLRVVVTDMLGNILQKIRTETNLSDGREKVVRKTFDFIHKTIAASEIPKRGITGIGVGHSGIIETQTGMVLSFPSWTNDGMEKCTFAEDG
jgi:N-acetylglucosamine repressor